MDYLQKFKLKKDSLYELLEEYEVEDDFYFQYLITRTQAQIDLLDEFINELEVEE